MKNVSLIFITCVLSGCATKNNQELTDVVIANGQMPAIAKDKNENLHIVYGTGDSIMYCFSADKGKTFSVPSLVSVLPGLVASHMRGPQIAATNNGINVIACNSLGDIFSYNKKDNKNWFQGNKVNDADTIAKEGFISVSGDGENAFAVWLDLRGNKRNKIYGAKSIDGGKTWSPNKLIYASPDSTVCECCKPSVLVRNNNVYVMFRNWLIGSRDLYLIQSPDGGNNFQEAQKLGNGSWKLNGCPMDGGGLVVNKEGIIQTAWRREKYIYASIPGAQEKVIGEGKGCTIEILKDKNVYAWDENGNLVVLDENGNKKMVGKGGLPVLKAIDDHHVICVWENDKQIHASVVGF